ncbi:transcription factor BIM3, partial [Trifolium medium]|nr:transcription factor BIM3 [Trifolium medium]
VVSSGMVTQQMMELPVSNADMATNLQHQVWLSKPNKDSYIVPNNTLKEQEEMKIESGSESDSVSSAYSQRLEERLLVHCEFATPLAGKPCSTGASVVVANCAVITINHSCTSSIRI